MATHGQFVSMTPRPKPTPRPEWRIGRVRLPARLARTTREGKKAQTVK